MASQSSLATSAVHYPTYGDPSIPLSGVKPTPLRGRYLRRSLHDRNEAAFIGADLHRGTKVLIEPSLQQCGLITGTDVSAIWWAEQRLEHRADIIAKRLPLVPPKAATNGAVPSVATISGVVPLVPAINGTALDFDRLVAIAKAVDTETWLAAGTAAGLR